MKTVGKRKSPASLEAAGAFLNLVNEMRERLPGRRHFIRRGVYRFRTFEEAQSSALAAQAGHDQTVCAPAPIEAGSSRKKMASS